MKNFKPAFTLAVAWLLMVTILLCIPGTEFPKITWQNKILLDKWVHVFLFLVLVVSWCRAYSRRQGQSLNYKKIFTTIMILSVLYGIIMEIVQQYFVPFRSFDLFDILADGLGSVIGYFISLKRFGKAEAHLR